MSARRINLNGDFDLWQLGALREAMPHDALVCDGWRHPNTTGAKVRAERSTDAPSFSAAGRFIGQSVKLTCTEPVASLPIHSIGGIVHFGEGYFWRPLHGKPLALSGWIKASLPGFYSCGVRTGRAPYKTFGAEIEVAAADTWQRFEIHIPQAPLDGGWTFESDTGFAVYFFLGGTSMFNGPVGQWADGGLGLSTRQVPWLSTQGATYHLAGVQLEACAVTPFEVWPFADELARAQRYVEKSFRLLQAPAPALGIMEGAHLFHAPRPASLPWQAPDYIRFATAKRVAPTIALFNPVTAGSAQIRNWSQSTDLAQTAADAITEFGFRISGYGGDLGNTLGIAWLADASVQGP